MQSTQRDQQSRWALIRLRTLLFQLPCAHPDALTAIITASRIEISTVKRWPAHRSPLNTFDLFFLPNENSIMTLSSFIEIHLRTWKPRGYQMRLPPSPSSPLPSPPICQERITSDQIAAFSVVIMSNYLPSIYLRAFFWRAATIFPIRAKSIVNSSLGCTAQLPLDHDQATKLCRHPLPNRRKGKLPFRKARRHT
jgi:hypothetical protein